MNATLKTLEGPQRKIEFGGSSSLYGDLHASFAIEENQSMPRVLITNYDTKEQIELLLVRDEVDQLRQMLDVWYTKHKDKPDVYPYEDFLETKCSDSAKLYDKKPRLVVSYTEPFTEEGLKTVERSEIQQDPITAQIIRRLLATVYHEQSIRKEIAAKLENVDYHREAVTEKLGDAYWLAKDGKSCS